MFLDVVVHSGFQLYFSGSSSLSTWWVHLICDNMCLLACFKIYKRSCIVWYTITVYLIAFWALSHVYVAACRSVIHNAACEQKILFFLDTFTFHITALLLQPCLCFLLCTWCQMWPKHCGSVRQQPCHGHNATLTLWWPMFKRLRVTTDGWRQQISDSLWKRTVWRGITNK